jgi:hypothetical protein
VPNNKFIYQNLVFLLIFSSLFVWAYFNFSAYRPQDLVDNINNRIKGVATYEKSMLLGMPHPLGSEQLGINTGKEAEQITLKINMSATKVHEFYKSTLQQNKWKLSSEEISDDHYLSEYKKDKSRLEVTISGNNSENESIVSIELLL